MMIGWLIIVCEIGFWVFVLTGLFTRYILKKKRLGGFLLLGTPIVDLCLLAFTVWDLKSGSAADTFHAVAAIYIGFTAAFGHKMIRFADQRFAYRFAGGPKPAAGPKFGKEHAKKERSGWYRHLLAWTIGCVLLVVMILLVNDLERTKELQNMILFWLIALSADFLYSFSYTLWPRANKKSETA